MYRYNIDFEVWPFFSIPQDTAGQRQQHYTLKADDMRGALTAAELFIDGVKRNPGVWQAPITAISRIKD